MNRTKKVVLTALIAILTTAITAVAAFAILSSMSERHNGFKVGSQSITISEDRFKISSDDVIKPDEPFEKNPTITNTGSVDCYIRAYIGFSDTSLKQNVELGLNNDWVMGDDGYYYYPKAVKPGQCVELFNSVTVHNISRFSTELFVYAESIDTNDNDYLTAWQSFAVSPAIGG